MNIRKISEKMRIFAALIIIAFPLFSVDVHAEEGETEQSLENYELTDESIDGETEEGTEDGQEEGSEEADSAKEVKVMQVRCDDTSIHAYISGADGMAPAEYQIGNIPVTDFDIHPIAEDKNAARTLIMVDNSISIPGDLRETVAETLKKIVTGAGENQTFRIATFSEEIKYLSDGYINDITALSNMIDTIAYADQETYLTDVLYDVVKEISGSDDIGYTRIIVVSDGVDNKPLGVTREELNKKLDENSLPIYTIGIDTGKNAEALENMFALSRVTECEYGVLGKEEEGEGDLATRIGNSSDISVFRANIPEEVKTGGVQNTRLTFSDESSISFSAQMPFSIKEEKEEKVEPTPAPKEIVPEPVPEPTLLQKILANKVLVIAVAFVLCLLIGLIIFLIIRKRNKEEDDTTPIAAAPTAPLEYGKTEILGADTDGKTTRLTPGDKPGEKRYKLKLVTASDNSRTFRCEIEREIKIGRMPDNDIVISDDTTVHGHHCTIEKKNDAFYFTDLMNVKNHSSINGLEIKPGFPQLITTNSKLTIGRFVYVVTISEE